MEIADGWQIIIGAQAAPVVANAASDLADYFSVSMAVATGIKKTPNLSRACHYLAKIKLLELLGNNKYDIIFH